MSNQGTVDDYLTKDEEAYFNSGGVEQADSLLEGIEGQQDESEQAESEASDIGDMSPNGESIDTTAEHVDEGAIADDKLAEQGDNEDEFDEPRPGKKRDLEKAFKAEHHKRKELRDALDANEKRTKELEANLLQMKEQLAKSSQPIAPQAPPEVIPDADVDPIGYQQYKINKLEQAISAHNQYLQQQYEQNQRVQQESAFMNHYQAQAKDFANKTPDFMDAYNFLMAGRIEEHMAAGFTEEQAKRLIVEDEIAVASLALKDKVNPAERIYNIAKTRGYVAKSHDKSQSSNTKSIDSLKKGLENSKSLKSGGGELEGRNKGIDEIDGMNFEEFDSYFSKIKTKQKNMR